MDHASNGLRTAAYPAPQENRLELWTIARHRIEALLDKVCKIMPGDELDAYERRRIETRFDALERAGLIRGTLNSGDASKSDI